MADSIPMHAEILYCFAKVRTQTEFTSRRSGGSAGRVDQSRNYCPKGTFLMRLRIRPSPVWKQRDLCRVAVVKFSFEENDEIWVAFDRDDQTRFEEAIALCKNHGIKVGRSNPCFEVWLILHIQEYNQIRPSNQMQALLSKLRPEYDKRGANKSIVTN